MMHYRVHPRYIAIGTRRASFPPRPRMPPRRHHILQGCCDEAERADVVSRNLQSLRNALPDSLHPHLDGVIYELGVTGRHLRDIADKAQVQIGRVPQILDYLNIVLPCLCKTLRDITAFYEDTTLTKDRRWRYMYHRLGNELPGTTLPARFIMYNQFLNLLRMMLSQLVLPYSPAYSSATVVQSPADKIFVCFGIVL